MLRVKRKIVSYILIFITVFTTIFASYVQSVYALENLPQVIYWVDVLVGLYNGLGEVVSDKCIEDFYTKYKDQIEAMQYTQNEDGTVTFSEDQVKQLCDLLDQYFEETPEAVDVVWMPVASSDKISANCFNTVSAYYKYRSWADNIPLGVVSGNLYHINDPSEGTENDVYNAGTSSRPVYYQRLVTVQSLNDTILTYTANGGTWDSFIPLMAYWTSIFGTVPSTAVGDVSSISFYTTDGIAATQDDFDYHAMTLLSGEVFPLSSNSNLFRGTRYSLYYPFIPVLLQPYGTGGVSYAMMFRGCNTDAPAYIPVFKSINAYKDWITGNGSYYKFDSGYQGGSITVNPNADYSAITDAIADVMKQSMANGENMSTMLSRMQAAFTKTLGEISGTLGDIEDNTQETNTWLEKIYGLLEAQQKQIEDYFAGADQSLDDLIGLLSHMDEDGNRTGIYDLFASFLLLFRVQQEDLQAYMADAQDFFKLFPFELKSWISAGVNEITDAIEEVRDAVRGISININPNDYIDPGGGDSGESLWTQLGEGVAKILTAVLGLVKSLIFKGLDALVYLVGVVGGNITGVFEDMEVYVDRVAVRFEGSSALLSALGGALPEPLTDMLVIFIFVLIICAIVSYVRR